MLCHDNQYNVNFSDPVKIRCLLHISIHSGNLSEDDYIRICSPWWCFLPLSFQSPWLACGVCLSYRHVYTVCRRFNFSLYDAY